MTSTLLLENLIAKVLFDSEATYSFISIDLASRIKKPKKELTKILLVITPLERLLSINKEINRCEIKIGEDTIENDLVILNLEDFDIILGID